MDYFKEVEKRSWLCRRNRGRVRRIIPYAVQAVREGGDREVMIAKVRGNLNVGSWSLILSALIPIIVDIIREIIERRRE